MVKIHKPDREVLCLVGRKLEGWGRLLAALGCEGAQARDTFFRHLARAKQGSVNPWPMKVAAASGDESVTIGQVFEIFHRFWFVLSVVHLNTGQVALAERGKKPLKIRDSGGMCQHSDTMNAVNQANGVSGSKLIARHIAWAVAAKVAIEGIGNVLRVAAFNKCGSNMGGPTAPAASSRTRSQV